MTAAQERFETSFRVTPSELAAGYRLELRIDLAKQAVNCPLATGTDIEKRLGDVFVL